MILYLLCWGLLPEEQFADPNSKSCPQQTLFESTARLEGGKNDYNPNRVPTNSVFPYLATKNVRAINNDAYRYTR
jgi:hypothetical protein